MNCVIVASSDELRFLRATLREAAHLFQEVLIMFGTRYWDEVRAENTNAIEAFKEECASGYTNVRVMWYRVPEDALNFMKGSVQPAMYWEGHARRHAVNEMKPCEYVLFLDSDEVIDGKEFAAFLAAKTHTHFSALKLANYWYWREPIYRAKDYLEDSAVLIRSDKFKPLHLYSNTGRHGVFANCHPSETKRMVMSPNGTPMIHHYSWVRSKEEMRKKVTTWGHREDRHDWLERVDEEFSRDFNGTDFLKQLDYITTVDCFGLLAPTPTVQPDA